MAQRTGLVVVVVVLNNRNPLFGDSSSGGECSEVCKGTGAQEARGAGAQSTFILSRKS